jgi:hypothetical protein
MSIQLNISHETSLLFQRALSRQKYHIKKILSDDLMDTPEQKAELQKEIEECTYFLTILKGECK